MLVSVAIGYVSLGRNIDIDVYRSFEGDSLGLAALVKGIQENGIFGLWFNERLGAPEVSVLVDGNGVDIILALFIWCISAFTKSTPRIQYIYYIFTFLLNACSMALLLRKIRVNYVVTFVFSILFTSAPYHFLRELAGHMVLTNYMYFAVSIYLSLNILGIVEEKKSEKNAKDIVGRYGQADLIIGNNVLAHVPDINSFVEGIRMALKPGGTVTMEFPHLLKLMQFNQFDTIYHEHFSYLSLLAVSTIFRKHGLAIYDVEELPTHGGSLRIYAAHRDCKTGKQAAPSVEKVLDNEKRYGLDTMEAYELFPGRVHKIKRDSTSMLAKLKEGGAYIAAFGAAAKGNTFLNYCGIGAEYIDFVADSSTVKQGLYLPGTRIPIVSPDMIRQKRPDYIVLLAWNLKEELSKLLGYTREWGCKFITFIPEVEVF